MNASTELKKLLFKSGYRFREGITNDIFPEVIHSLAQKRWNEGDVSRIDIPIMDILVWLHEKRGIWVWVEFGVNPDGFYPVIQDIKNKIIHNYKYQFCFDSPKKAYECGITYCLKNLVSTLN